MGLLEDKVVLISGSGGGQGREAALTFALEGAKIVGCDLNAEQARQTASLVRAAGGSMISVDPLDLSLPSDAQAWISAAIAQWGRIDVLYNNAAAIKFAAFEDATIDHWDFTIRNELTLSYISAMAVWPQMVHQKSGVIINVASIAGHMEVAGFPAVAHGVANAGLQALSRTLAAAGAVHGIRALSLSPGVVLNPNAPAPFNDASEPAMRALYAPAALGRPAKIKEIVEVAAFLASDKASYMTGCDIAVDGGMSGIIWRP